MCGRFTLTSSDDQLRDLFQVFNIPSREAKYNIAPFQNIIVIINPPRTTPRIAKLARWGFEQNSTDQRIFHLINARAETVLEKPTFASSFRDHRCLIPATGFFEWKHSGTLKQPYLFQQKNSAPFAFAGIYRVDDTHPEQISCVILTTKANTIVQEIHDRMPVILEEKDYEQWLEKTDNPASLLELCESFEAAKMRVTPVNPCVNKVSIDAPKCIDRAEVQGDLF